VLGIFLDIEATGLDSQKHRVLEIAFRVIDLCAGAEKASFLETVKQPLQIWEQSDPMSLEINGFTWEENCKGKEETQVEKEIISCLESLQIKRGNAVFVCQNPSFDRTFFSQLVGVYKQEELLWPYHWLDFASMFWALEIQNETFISALEGGILLSKNKIAEFYNLPPEEKPHRAMNGVDHLILCYEKVVGWPIPAL